MYSFFKFSCLKLGVLGICLVTLPYFQCHWSNKFDINSYNYTIAMYSSYFGIHAMHVRTHVRTYIYTVFIGGPTGFQNILMLPQFYLACLTLQHSTACILGHLELVKVLNDNEKYQTCG